MDTHKRRTFWQWLARKAQVQARLNREEKESWFRMGMAYVTKKPVDLAFRDYPRFLDEQASAQITPEQPPAPQEPTPPRLFDTAMHEALQTAYQQPGREPGDLRRVVQAQKLRLKQQPGRP